MAPGRSRTGSGGRSRPGRAVPDGAGSGHPGDVGDVEAPLRLGWDLDGPSHRSADRPGAGRRLRRARSGTTWRSQIAAASANCRIGSEWNARYPPDGKCYVRRVAGRGGGERVECWSAHSLSKSQRSPGLQSDLAVLRVVTLTRSFKLRLHGDSSMVQARSSIPSSVARVTAADLLETPSFR